MSFRALGFLPLGLLSAWLSAWPALAQDVAELTVRIDRLEALVRQLNGQLERAENDNRRLADQLRRLQADVDFRLREMEGARGGTAARPAPSASASPGQPAPGQGTPARIGRGDAFNPDAQPNAPGAPRPLGQGEATAAPRPVRPVGPVAIPGQIMPGAPNAMRDQIASSDPAQPLPAAVPPAAPQTIDGGRQQLAAGDFAGAEATFRAVLATNPRGGRAADALLGLGDSFLRRERWREAAEQYVDVTTRFPRSRAAPEAELKLGMALRGLGAVAEACAVLRNHAGKYPEAPAAIRQGVQREITRARCG